MDISMQKKGCDGRITINKNNTSTNNKENSNNQKTNKCNALFI